jgi:hypothetical protein
LIDRASDVEDDLLVALEVAERETLVFESLDVRPSLSEDGRGGKAGRVSLSLSLSSSSAKVFLVLFLLAGRGGGGFDFGLVGSGGARFWVCDVQLESGGGRISRPRIIFALVFCS